MKTIGITGGTGFVGRHLTDLLVGKGYKVCIFTRSYSKDASKQVTYAHWDVKKGECDVNALKNLHAVVHLAGASIADKRWTAKRKKEILDSRVNGTNFMVSKLKEFAPECKTFIAASAMGFYGPDTAGKIPFTEDAPAGNDFLGNTTMLWEQATQKASDFSRLVVFRFGIILGKDDGAFPQFAKPVSLCIKPILGTGKQVISWIEAGDLCRLILYAIENGGVKGIYNAVTPNPVTQKQLVDAIADGKHWPAVPFPVPAFLLKLMLGEMSSEALKSCTVSAEKVMQSGFKFENPGIAQAIAEILKRR